MICKQCADAADYAVARGEELDADCPCAECTAGWLDSLGFPIHPTDCGCDCQHYRVGKGINKGSPEGGDEK